MSKIDIKKVGFPQSDMNSSMMSFLSFPAKATSTFMPYLESLQKLPSRVSSMSKLFLFKPTSWIISNIF